MKLEKFALEFTKPQAVYLGGESVEGELLLKLNRPMKIKGSYEYFHMSVHNTYTSNKCLK